MHYNLSVMLEAKLIKIGLSKKEAVVYITCLRLGSQPASVIAKYSDINRATVHNIFEKLIKKGLATKIIKGSTTYFQVLDPENLINYLERNKNELIQKIEKQKNEIKEFLPAIKSLESPISIKPKVRFYEGDKGMREAYENILKSKESIRSYYNEEAEVEIPNLFPGFPLKRKEKGIFCRTLTLDNKLGIETKKFDKEMFRETKLIPHKNYTFSATMVIHDDKVYIFSWQEKMAIAIISAEAADFHKKMFDLLWSKLK